MPETDGVSPSRSEVDDDFAEFVRARQHQVLRVARLLCGDPQVADELAQRAFVTLAMQWSAVRDDLPDTFVRTALYRDSLTLRHSGSHDVPPLDKLTPKERAVTVLLQFERRSEREAAEILGLSVSGVRSRAHAGDGLAGLLADAAEPVVERDFVDAARSGARERRRRRRRVGMGVVMAVALLAAAFVVVPRGVTTDRATPAPSPSTSGPSSLAARAEWDPASFDLLDVTTQVGPDLAQISTLPKIDELARSQLALPEVLAFGPDTDIPTLRETGNNSAPVRAVLLRYATEGLRPVLVRPTLSNPFMVVDTMTLVPNLDEGGNASEPLEVTAIAGDRRHVLFLQPSKVLVLDAFTGEVQTFAVADKYLNGGGWTSSGQSLIVWSDTKQWRITPATGQVQRLARTAYPGRHQVVASADGVRVLAFDAQGATTKTLSGPRVLGGVWGSTFTNLEKRVATGGFLSDAAVSAVNGLFQGVFTVDSAGMASARLLLAPGGEEVSTGCCEVLGWGFKDQILIRWNGRDLLAWDVRTGGLQRVSTLPGPREQVVTGASAAVVALAP